MRTADEHIALYLLHCRFTPEQQQSVAAELRRYSRMAIEEQVLLCTEAAGSGAGGGMDVGGCWLDLDLVSNSPRVEIN